MQSVKCEPNHTVLTILIAVVELESGGKQTFGTGPKDELRVLRADEGTTTTTTTKMVVGFSQTKRSIGEEEGFHLPEFNELVIKEFEECDAAVRELESQLKINTVETKLSYLKIESLQAENQRLQAQFLDHSKEVNKLESAKEREGKSETDDLEVERRMKRLKDLEEKDANMVAVSLSLAEENLDFLA
ncbi:hypothetical protein AXF42_Ash001098 [Apostasia shenzhenica]|uniref:Uncharacterized protein n=1 Tax=Apostasia shenzhenica TaxID=1088818 RepID=A0A2I0ATX6_9ASPA|nr:hypothetical protein AXF42_Ash001098 [Apostasia shenzhenica]